MRGEHLEPGSKMAGAQGRRHGKERGKGRGLERFKWTGSGNARKPPNNILEQTHRDRPCRMRQVVRFSDVVRRIWMSAVLSTWSWWKKRRTGRSELRDHDDPQGLERQCSHAGGRASQAEFVFVLSLFSCDSCFASNCPDHAHRLHRTSRPTTRPRLTTPFFSSL